MFTAGCKRDCRMSGAEGQNPDCLLLVSDRVHNVYCSVSESRMFTAGCKRDCRMSGAED